MNRRALIAVVVLISVAGWFDLGRTSEPVTKHPPPPYGEVVSWKTYRNEVYGLAVKHPASWAVKTENKDLSLRNTLKEFGGHRVEVVVLEEKSGSNVTIMYLGTNLNFSDCPRDISQEECLNLRETYKLNLDRFMELMEHNESFQNVKKTVLNGYNAYEIDFTARVSEDGGHTYREDNAFILMVEDTEGGVFSIRFADRPTKTALSPTERQVLSTFQFIQ